VKKLLGSTLALVLLVPTMANAELLKNLQVSGSLDVADVSANNITDFSTTKYDKLNTIQTRLMVGADWDLLDDVHSHISLLKNNRTYGSGAETLTSVQSDIIVQEANVKIDKLFGALDTKVGRQYYGDPGDMVIYFGPRNDYGLTVTALDGATFVWSGDKVGAKVLLAKVSNNGLTTSPTNLTSNDFANVTIAGVDVNVKPSDNASGNAYLYDRETVNSGGTTVTGVQGNDYLYVAGLKGKVTMGGAWLKAEIAKDFGTNRNVTAVTGVPTTSGNYTGMAGLLELGDKVDVANVGTSPAGLRPAGERAALTRTATSRRSRATIVRAASPDGSGPVRRPSWAALPSAAPLTTVRWAIASTSARASSTPRLS
jgi:hypothetical protein